MYPFKILESEWSLSKATLKGNTYVTCYLVDIGPSQEEKFTLICHVQKNNIFFHYLIYEKSHQKRNLLLLFSRENHVSSTK